MKFPKRSFFIAIIFIALLAAQAYAGQTVLKIATLSPEGTFLIDRFKEATVEIEKLTQGRVTMKIYPGGVMGNDTRVLQKMRIGQLHGATFTAGGISKVYKNYQIMSLPMLFDNYAQVDAIRPIMDPILTKELGKNGFVSFGIVEAGFVYMMSNYSLGGVDDLKGKKVWIPEGDPIGRAVFETAGVPPVPLPLAGVLTGLQTGLIDTFASSPIGAVVLQWYTKVKYITDYPLLYAYGTFVLSQKAWNKVPEQDKPVVRKILEGAVVKANMNTRQENQKAMATLKKQGIQFVPMNPDQLGSMKNISNTATAKLIEQGEFDSKMLQQIRDLLKNAQ